jgi:hypothetical protein
LVDGLLAQGVGGLQPSQSAVGSWRWRRVEGRGGPWGRDGWDGLFGGRGGHVKGQGVQVVPGMGMR